MPSQNLTSMIAQTLGHYRILDKIGEGGMGVVFRALDEQLDREVALKVLPSGALTDETSRKQFRTEALALAKLSHPNIETVFEFNSQDGIDFLALELIPGIPLKDKLKGGPLPEKEVLRLGIQLAEGLAAAHGRGVIHRDLKPANLFVSADGRLKILDFGLAKLARMEFGSEATQTITTEHSTISGTIPYMSPQQLSGLPLDARCDIYSAGVVLYEMAVGVRPFAEEHGARLIGAILHQTPPLPSTVNPRISPGLESVIIKALEKEPEQRYQSAGELRAALSGVTAASGITERGLQRPPIKHSPWLKSAIIGSSVLVAALCIAIGLNVGGIRSRLFHSGGTSVSAIPPRPSIAVLGLKNPSGKADQPAFSTSFDEVLTYELGAGEKLRTIPEESVAQMQISLALPGAISYSPGTLSKIRKNLNTDYVVVGSYMPIENGQVRVDLTVQNAVTGDTVGSVSVRGSEPEDLASRAATELRAKLGIAAVSPREASEVEATFASSPQAEELYAEGLGKMRSFDNLAGRDILRKAVQIDPQFALAHSALAKAWKNLGYDNQAEAEAKKAFELSADLPAEHRKLVEAQYRETTGEWGEAIKIYDSLFTLYSDNVEYGLLLAQAQAKAGKGKDAITTSDLLRSLPPPSGQDVRIDLAEAEASRSIGDSKQVQSWALSAAEKARTNGARLLLARALLLASSADENLGQVKDAASAAQESEAIYDEAHDRNSVAYTVEVQADVLADEGDLVNATLGYKKELAIAREIGNRQAESSALVNLGLVLGQQGDLAAARQNYQRAVTVFREIGDRKNFAMTLVNMGELVQEEGDLAEALKTYEQAIALSHEVGDKKGEANGLTTLASALDAQGKLTSAKEKVDQAIVLDLQSGNKTASADRLVAQGDVLRHLGQLGGAEKSYYEALQVAKVSGDVSNSAWAYMGMGAIALQRADWGSTQNWYSQALATRNEIGEKQNLATTRVALAELAVAEGHADQAVADLGPIREELRKENRVPDTLLATSLIVKGLLAEQKIQEAGKELDTANALIAKNQNAALQMQLNIDKARIQIASGTPTEAVTVLNRVLSQARGTGFLQYEFEARLALGEANLKSGRSTQAKADLNKLQVEATQKGFVRIARKAIALRS